MIPTWLLAKVLLDCILCHCSFPMCLTATMQSTILLYPISPQRTDVITNKNGIHTTLLYIMHNTIIVSQLILVLFIHERSHYLGFYLLLAFRNNIPKSVPPCWIYFTTKWEVIMIPRCSLFLPSSSHSHGESLFTKVGICSSTHFTPITWIDFLIALPQLSFSPLSFHLPPSKDWARLLLCQTAVNLSSSSSISDVWDSLLVYSTVLSLMVVPSSWRFKARTHPFFCLSFSHSFDLASCILSRAG